MIGLSDATLDRLPPTVRRFTYERAAIAAGIVHLSVGNFHRAHQALYVDRLLELPGNETWGLCGVGLLDTVSERFKATSFREQDNLYTLTRYPATGAASHRVIGAMVEYLFAPENIEAVLQRLADPATRIVTMTITEGGYNQDERTGTYRLDTPAVRAELADPERPVSAFGFIVEGLRRRRLAGSAPFTVVSCDNMRNNGGVVRQAILSHAGALDSALAAWIEEHVAFPGGMVDGITPAVDAADTARIDAASGVADLVPVYAEDYATWVLEDRFSNGRPPLERVGVQMVADVRPYELAKLRLLNASHSMLAYPGLLAGRTLVSDAVAEPAIRFLLERFMEFDVIPTLPTPPGMDLHEYKDLLLERFSNPALPDRLLRICGDGCAKLPIFLGPTVENVVSRGADQRRLAFGIACFVRYLAGVADDGTRFEPSEPHLAPDDRALAFEADLAAPLRMSMFHGFGIAASADFAATFVRMRESLLERGTLATLRSLLER